MLATVSPLPTALDNTLIPDSCQATYLKRSVHVHATNVQSEETLRCRPSLSDIKQSKKRSEDHRTADWFFQTADLIVKIHVASCET